MGRDKPYQCDDCAKEFHVEISAYGHAHHHNHTVRYWGDGDPDA